MNVIPEMEKEICSGQFEVVDFKMKEMIWKLAPLVKAVTADKVAGSPYLAWISLCFAQEKHRREQF